ncbi:hypothetical protein D3C73_15800 [compost metagenome]
MSKSGKSTNVRRSETSESGTIGLYHDMLVSENFDRCAQRIFSILRKAQKEFPGKKRVLYLDVQGHRNSAGGYDDDAYEIISHFALTFLGPYLSEIHTPLLHVRNPQKQNDDMPEQLNLVSTENQKPLVRDESPVARKTKPTSRNIQDYLGMDERCFICWQSPVERAHAVPHSLGGSNDIRNIVLLCKRHHVEAPDVNDPEAFWNWLDWRLDEEGRFDRREIETKDDFFTQIKDELIGLYKWTPEEVDSLINPALLQEYYKVMEASTTTHFGIKRKSSTEAWAFNQARLNL